jgi:hypothetical protein
MQRKPRVSMGRARAMAMSNAERQAKHRAKRKLEHAALYEHIRDMSWMFTAEYGYHTQADRNACPDYRHSLATLRKLAGEG